MQKKTKQWHQLAINVARKNAEKLSELLSNHGAVAVTFLSAEKTQPIIIQSAQQTSNDALELWQQTTLQALFNDQISLEHAEKILKLTVNATSYNAITTSIIQDNDWKNSYKQHFSAHRIGQHLWLCPSWDPQPAPENRQAIIMDPGMAFGSGSHETTTLCLEWIDQHIKGGETLIDYGCGSGILAIAANKLGAENIIAIDIDPDSLAVTQDNAQNNQIPADQLTILPINHHMEITDIGIIIANITLNPLLTLLETFHQYLKQSGTLILSGILENQMDTLKQHSRKLYRVTNIEQKNEWCRIDLVKR